MKKNPKTKTIKKTPDNVELKKASRLYLGMLPLIGASLFSLYVGVETSCTWIVMISFCGLSIATAIMGYIIGKGETACAKRQ